MVDRIYKLICVLVIIIAIYDIPYVLALIDPIKSNLLTFADKIFLNILLIGKLVMCVCGVLMFKRKGIARYFLIGALLLEATLSFFISRPVMIGGVMSIVLAFIYSIFFFSSYGRKYFRVSSSAAV